MTTTQPISDNIQHFIANLDTAVAKGEPAAICEGVKAALRKAVLEIPLDLSSDWFEESPEGYARRLLHRCPNKTYSVMVMVWGPGQGTPVHDHAGKWCVECVHHGQIKITAYDPVSDLSADTVEFEEIGVELGNQGDVGILVPPNEYHKIENVTDQTAVTIHVYAGEMLWCHAFHHVEGNMYRKERRDLKYSD